MAVVSVQLYAVVLKHASMSVCGPKQPGQHRMLRARAPMRALLVVGRLPAASRAFHGVTGFHHVLPGRPLKCVARPVVMPGQRRWGSPMPGGCLEHYLQLRAAGELQEDPHQEVCMNMLDDLAKDLMSYNPKMTKAAAGIAPARFFCIRFLSRKHSHKVRSLSGARPRQSPRAPLPPQPVAAWILFRALFV